MHAGDQPGGLHLRGNGQWTERPGQREAWLWLEVNSVPVHLFKKKNSVPVQQPCFIAEVVEGGGWTKLEWPQRMGHLHGPTGVSQPIPFSGRQRGGKIS